MGVRTLASAIGAAAIFAGLAGGAVAACISPDTLAPKLSIESGAGDAAFVVADVVTPEVLYLGVVAYARRNEGAPMVHRWPERGSGGIDRWRMCANVSVGPAEVAMGELDWRQLAVALQVGVDYGALYPREIRRLAGSGQLVRGAAGGYRLARFAEEAPSKGADLYEDARAEAGACPGLVVWGRRSILFPAC